MWEAWVDFPVCRPGCNHGNNTLTREAGPDHRAEAATMPCHKGPGVSGVPGPGFALSSAGYFNDF